MPVPIQLRPVQSEDLDVIFEQQRDPESVAMAGVKARDREAFDAHWRKIRAEPTNRLFVIESQGVIVGNMGSWLADGRRLLGYWIDRAHWGRGIATAAVTEFLAQEPDRPILAHVAKHNVGSRRVLEKCGFTIVDEGLVTDLGGDPFEEFVFRID